MSGHESIMNYKWKVIEKEYLGCVCDYNKKGGSRFEKRSLYTCVLLMTLHLKTLHVQA